MLKIRNDLPHNGFFYLVKALQTKFRSDMLPPVMWIRIGRMRIRIQKIWSMRIRIQDNKITNLISNNLLKVKKKNIFKSLPNFLNKLLF